MRPSRCQQCARQELTLLLLWVFFSVSREEEFDEYFEDMFLWLRQLHWHPYCDCIYICLLLRFVMCASHCICQFQDCYKNKNNVYCTTTITVCDLLVLQGMINILEFWKENFAKHLCRGPKLFWFINLPHLALNYILHIFICIQYVLYMYTVPGFDPASVLKSYI